MLSKARNGLGLTERSLIERRKLPVCATLAETIYPFHYVLIRGFRLDSLRYAFNDLDFFWRRGSEARVTFARSLV